MLNHYNTIYTNIGSKFIESIGNQNIEK